MDTLPYGLARADTEMLVNPSYFSNGSEVISIEMKEYHDLPHSIYNIYQMQVFILQTVFNETFPPIMALPLKICRDSLPV